MLTVYSVDDGGGTRKIHLCTHIEENHRTSTSVIRGRGLGHEKFKLSAVFEIATSLKSLKCTTGHTGLRRVRLHKRLRARVAGCVRKT
jgi:hypothetical protein